uniref:ESPR-type extended signal peptide-containing protein n=1 Tax=Enterobacter bugandensis TaxID=881260 RepID=UPI002A81F14F
MNAIYKVIFNRKTGQPVVVSEFGRGKVKSNSSSKIKLSIATLVIAVSMSPSYASVCDALNFTCQLDDIWTTGSNNQGNGKVSIVDGNEWDVSGLTTWKGSQKSFANYGNLKDVLSNGYFVSKDGVRIDPSVGLPGAGILKRINYSGLTKIIEINDPITNAIKTVNVYENTAISLIDAYDIGYSPTFMVKDANVYVNTRLVDVSSGAANISLNEDVFLTGELRDSKLVNVNGVDKKAEVAWNSVNTIVVDSPVDWSGAKQDNKIGIINNEFKGEFFTFDGTKKYVSNLSEFQAYNDWLISQIQLGNLDYSSSSSAYQNALKMAYDENKVTFEFSQFYDGANASTYGSGDGAVIFTTGEHAKATISKGAMIETSTASGDVFKILHAQNKSEIINNGSVLGTGRLVDISSGASFVNNGLLSLGGGSIGKYNSGFYNYYPVHASGKDSRVTNNGVFNINARYAYGNKGSNGTVNGLWLQDYAVAVNNSLINSGYWGNGGIKDEFSGTINSIAVQSYASFTNGKNGVITLGVGEDGVTADYLSSGSSAIKADNDGIGINDGTITLGSTSDGVYGFFANGFNVKMLNNGIININTDGDGGQYSNTQSIGIFSQSGASGIIDNLGVINVNGGNNVGIKAIDGGQASSSGMIYVNASTGMNNLRNYGVWVEGASSEVGISGGVNLNGDHAIGIHARSGGTISLEGNAAVNFVSGKKQIGYFVYGAGSQIINNSSSVQDVTSVGSTLMRLDGGANFTGNSGPGSIMVASGQDSLILLATGTGTSISTGSLTLDLTGQGATGVLIEGGATGVINTGTKLNLDNSSAVAAIADGDGHDLNGAVSISGNTSTKLVSSAVLSSDKDRVTGYIARNGATLDNSGNISFTGANTTGLEVLDGSRGINSGSVTVSDGSLGLVANSSNQKTIIDNTGDLTLKGGSDVSRTTGISASGNAVTVNMTAGTIRLEGQGAVGVKVTDGASVNLAGTALPVFANQGAGVSNQIAFLISGAGSTLNANTTSLMDASGKASTLFRIENGASQQGVLTYDVSGENARGIWATGAGTLINAASGSHLSVQGTGAQGIYAAGGASAALEQGVTADLTGSGAVVGVVDGNEYDLAGSVTATNTGTVLTNEADISSGLAGATAFITQNQGMLVNKGNIDLTTGTGNTGIKVISGQFDNQASDITVSGVAVDVEGANSTVFSTGGSIIATDGEAAIRLSQGASLDLVGSGLGVVEGQGTAHGVLLDTGAAGLTVTGAQIDVKAAGATGNGIENRAEIAGIQLNNTTINVQNGNGVRTSANLAQQNSGTINVAGSGTGLAFMAADGGMTGNDLDLSGSSGLTINLYGSNGNGILANTA